MVIPTEVIRLRELRPRRVTVRPDAPIRRPWIVRPHPHGLTEGLVEAVPTGAVRHLVSSEVLAEGIAEGAAEVRRLLLHPRQTEERRVPIHRAQAEDGDKKSGFPIS